MLCLRVSGSADIADSRWAIDFTRRDSFPVNTSFEVAVVALNVLMSLSNNVTHSGTERTNKHLGNRIQSENQNYYKFLRILDRPIVQIIYGLPIPRVLAHTYIWPW